MFTKNISLAFSKKKRLYQVSFSRFVIIFLIVVLTLSGNVLPATAQSGSLLIFNKNDIFKNTIVCENYELFLEMKPVKEIDSKECHALARLIIEIGETPTFEFINSLKEKVSSSTTLGSMVQTVDAISSGNILSAFELSALSSRRISIQLTQSGDIERAALYSHFLYEIQLRAFQAVCKDNFRCGELVSLSRIPEMFGSEFSFLESAAPDIALLCLMKSDAYLLPVRSFLASARFQNCISTEGFKK